MLAFAPGVASRSISVALFNDTARKSTETINLTLSSPSNATLGTPNPATLSRYPNCEHFQRIDPILTYSRYLDGASGDTGARNACSAARR